MTRAAAGRNLLLVMPGLVPGMTEGSRSGMMEGERNAPPPDAGPTPGAPA